MIDLSIVIVNYNAKSYLKSCLRSIFETINSITFEVFVVDNRSSEKIDEMMKSEFPEVKTIFNDTNEGFSKANNKAIKKCSGRYILLLNNDTVLMADAVKDLYSFMERSPETGIAGPQILSGDQTLQESFYKKPTLLSEFLRKAFYNRSIKSKDSFLGKILHHKYQQEQEVDWLTGACLMTRKDALEAAGLFDENFFMYFEDADLCIRVREKGWKVKYTPQARIIHYGGRSRKTNEIMAAREYRVSQLYFYKKYHSKLMLNLLKAYLLLKCFYHASFSIVFFLIRKKNMTNLKENLTVSGNLFFFIFKYN